LKKKGLQRPAGRKLKNFIKPMLAKQSDRAFSGKDWLFEIKWDGYRAIASVNKTEVSLYSRNGIVFNEMYPQLIEELKGLNIDAIVDGEIVVLDENGKSDFQGLQNYVREGDKMPTYMVFDVLAINGQNTTNIPLKERKRLLQQLLGTKSQFVKFSDHITARGEAFFKEAVKLDLEGIIAKKMQSPYRAGVRSGEWLKIKNHLTQEAIIVGFTQPGGSRKYFGALILGILDGLKLKYVGHTGSGFNEKDLAEIYSQLQKLIIKKSPFDEVIKTNSPVTWVKPLLVCEIKFTEWTKNGQFRHPIFVRLRSDKSAEEIDLGNNGAFSSVPKQGQNRKGKKENDIHSANKRNRVKLKKKVKEKMLAPEDVLAFGRIKVKLTNLSKVFWPEKGITKGDVIQYYQSISQYILPYLKGRPQSLLRHPNGYAGSSFYHKDAGGDAPSYVSTKLISSASSGKEIEYIICNNAATLAYMNNLGCIEINPWHSKLRSLDKPDYLIIDIDPSKNNTFEQVIEAANLVNDVLKRGGITGYCKTSGASGLHIYVPTQRKYSYDQLKYLSQLICLLAHEEAKEYTSLERSLKRRGDDKIYLDYLQNRRGQTIASVYSLRPREGATVSMPLKWSEVKSGLSPLQFDIYNAAKRIGSKGDLFSGVLGKGLNLRKCLQLLDK
jgi:bifunctional non-homologous end joining protein LigD